ncbi:unnamed protein product [Albugo candida]|uniref:Uncharacterized protein n=1 Tax=Albugo candida TaxID=65357 RepID=A0A024GS73_9STRA|nr:unnamed protein product [Albugo candida]|eukprot:CCI49211.1 unnamed protein product [Albugo candida]
MAEDSSPSTRYATLLEQIVHLNTDLQKAVSLNQAIQLERDESREQSAKLSSELMRLHERYERMQKAFFQATEQKIEADRRHEELITKWKKQLESKAREFELLQSTFAPPKDLEQLRLEIQEELEGPQMQKMDSLRQEVENHRQAAFQYRRDYELLKSEYEQFATDQANEVESLQAAHDFQISDLKQQLKEGEEHCELSQLREAVKHSTSLRIQAEGEIKELLEELAGVREVNEKLQKREESDHLNREKLLVSVQARNVALELDFKAKERQLNKLQHDWDGLRIKFSETEAKLIEASINTDKQRDQIRQQEALLLSSHTSVSTRLREEQSAWERERLALQERVQLLTQRLQSAELTSQAAPNYNKTENSDEMYQLNLRLKTKEADLADSISQVQSMEKQILMKQDEIQQLQQKAEDVARQHSLKAGDLQKTIQQMETERERMMKQLQAAQEVSSKLKTECVSHRNKVKEVEYEYKTLQSTHRDTLQDLEEIKLESSQMDAKLGFLERDLTGLTEQLEEEKEAHKKDVREWQAFVLQQHKLKLLAAEHTSQSEAFKEDMKRAMKKIMHELNKTQRKRDAYKHKCLEAHSQCKRLSDDISSLESKIREMKQAHQLELRHLLEQIELT